MTNQMGYILLGVFLSGMILGATAMFHLVKFEIVLPGFRPLPFLFAWLVIVFSWLLGRAVGIDRLSPTR
jgi:hypothetical protein